MPVPGLVLATLLLGGGQSLLAAAPIPDPELAQLRGGFRLPSGIDVALTVQTQTAVDGQVVLRTAFRADNGAPTLVAYVPKPGETVAAAPVRVATGGAPTVTYDSRSGVIVTPGAPVASVAGDLGALPAGLEEARGAASGVRVTDGKVATAVLDAGDLTVTHLAGAAFGSAIANVASDRVIETQTSVAIRLDGAGPDVLGSSMFRVEGLALDALAGRAQ